jgi:deoxyribonuclease-4
MPVASHASYLVNLATNKNDLLEKSIASLVLEFERCHELGIPYVVMHPGSHGGDGVEAGLARFVAGLDRAYQNSGRAVTLLLETTAGQGTGLGSRFEEIAYIVEHSDYKDYLGVCVDTCHIFAAGYELRDAVGYARTMTELDKSIGIHRVKFFHLNDSKKELGSRVDRHEHIGHGTIGLEGFKNLLTDTRFKGLPMTLETPKSDSLIEDTENLQTLRSLL